jgi:hypothetical protein
MTEVGTVEVVSRNGHVDSNGRGLIARLYHCSGGYCLEALSDGQTELSAWDRGPTEWIWAGSTEDEASQLLVASARWEGASRITVKLRGQVISDLWTANADVASV